MRRFAFRTEYFVAVGILALALFSSPLGIQLISGRIALSLRITLISLVVTTFLILLAAAILTSGRIRRGFFFGILLIFPLAAVCGLEAVAQAVRFADIVSPLSDMSVYKNRARYPGYLRSDIRSITQEQDGVRLYLPWKGEGVEINALGLRTALPSPKQPGEWRIAITGGSTAWGFLVLDADTIAMQFENILRREGHTNVRVYNFGIGGRELRHELDLLKKFRNEYAIDQVIFYTGANDVGFSFMRQLNPGDGENFQLETWELIKTAQRLNALIFPATKGALEHLQATILPKLLADAQLLNSIRDAQTYCDETGLICDFVLQPTLMTRRSPSGTEREMQRSLLRLYPGVDAVVQRTYENVMAQQLKHPVHDFSRALDDSPEQFYGDLVHLSEAGNRLIAERLAAQIGVRTK